MLEYFTQDNTLPLIPHVRQEAGADSPIRCFNWCLSANSCQAHLDTHQAAEPEAVAIVLGQNFDVTLSHLRRLLLCIPVAWLLQS